jgi:predicted transcriptional regulator
MFAKTKNTIKSENEIARIPQEGRYVLRDDCHSHIDMLTSKIALIKEETCEIKKDVRMLVEAAIKK